MQVDHEEAADPLGLPSVTKGATEEAILVRSFSVKCVYMHIPPSLLPRQSRVVMAFSTSFPHMFHMNDDAQHGGGALPPTVSTLRRVAIFLSLHKRCV
jgi:hypothetical protein